VALSNRTIVLQEPVYRYLLEHSLRETPVLRRLREATMTHAWARMQIAPEQGQFLALLVELSGARRGLEIGTYTGYSALWLASALPPDGQLVCCDINAEWTAVGVSFWEEAGVRGRIDLRLAPALETLDRLLVEEGEGGFDLAFVDADKENYLAYYERCLRLVRRGGLILFDNTLWGGAVADPEQQDAETVAIRQLNQRLHQDARISLSLVPIGDGLTLARRR
jgi:O-methyltransferase